MKVTVINKKAKNNFSLFNSILLLTLGIILTFNSDGFISTIFSFLGIIVILYGIYRFVSYSKIRSQFQVEKTEMLISAIGSISIGILVILLSNFLANTIQIVTGIWLFFVGLSKLGNAFTWKDVNQKKFITEIISSIIILLLGIYTIVAENVVFVFIGILLIVYAVFDIVNYFIKKK